MSEIAWAAGFFDGEGWFTNDGKRLRLGVGQSGSREELDRFHAAIGGLGKVYGPYKHSGKGTFPNAKQRYALHVWGGEAHCAAAMLYPYLSSAKRRQYDERRHLP